MRLNARVGQLATLFTTSSLANLRNLDVGNVTLQPGSRFEIEMTLRAPVGRLFNVAGAESLFRRNMPDSLDLVDVRSRSDNKVTIETRVRDVPGEAQMGIAPLLIGMLGFIASKWVLISLLTIGVALSLGFLVSAVTGRGVPVVDQITKATAGFSNLGVIALIGFGAVLIMQNLPQRRRR
jgi:hypothetical protein